VAWRARPARDHEIGWLCLVMEFHDTKAEEISADHAGQPTGRS
jgi:hypothetical protein